MPPNIFVTPEEFYRDIKFRPDEEAEVLATVDPNVDPEIVVKGTVYEIATWLLRIPVADYKNYAVRVADCPLKFSAEEFMRTKTGPVVERKEAVNHPSHYNKGKFEVIDVIEDWKLGFNLGNTVKYVARAAHKNPEKEIEDLEKASWYLTREINRLREEKR